MVTRRLRILHLSDLHERVALPWMPPERKRLIQLGEAARARVLEGSFFEVLHDIARSGPIDIVCFTGDIADWGLAEEYVQAEILIRKILTVVRVPVERLFLVPGNHDVRRDHEQDAWRDVRTIVQEEPDKVSRWMGGLAPPRGANAEWREAILSRTTAFWDWVSGALGRPSLRPSANLHERLGYRQLVLGTACPFPVHVIGLDSAWLCGDNNDCEKIHLTQHQVDMHTRNGRQMLDGFRVALVHHPLTALADHHLCQRLLAETVDLLLHGHEHVPVVEEALDPDRQIRIMAAGSLYEGDLGDKWVNAFHVIDAHFNEVGRPLKYVVEFWGWSNRGHWHRNGALYKAADNGRLTWWTPLGKRESDPKRLDLSSASIDLIPTETPVAPDDSKGIASQAASRRADLTDSELLRGLIEKVSALLKSISIRDIEPYATELEKQLRLSGHKGEVFREGWITLAKVENFKLQNATQAAQPVDATRLRALLREADNVID